MARVHLVLDAVLERQLAILDLFPRCGEVGLREAHRFEESHRWQTLEQAEVEFEVGAI
jgi:hypothetical protein